MERDERDERRMARIAEAVADETPVDWMNAAPETPKEAATLEKLRAIQSIAAAYRTAGSSEGNDAPLFTWRHLRARSKIGEGTSGEVFRAFDTILERDVALKLWRRLPGDERDSLRLDVVPVGHARRSLAEARRLARVRHPNVVTVYGADVAEGRVGVWSELVFGRTLEETLARNGPLGAAETTLIGVELCRALAAVHGAGIVHGDVKAANVMRRDGGGIVLLDFGSGRDLIPTRGEGGSVTGTPLAIAPEVAQGGAADIASDIYSLGVLLYRLATNRYPVQASSWDELVAKHARGERTALRDARPDLPDPFVAVVEHALAHDARARYRSSGEMERALLETIGEAASGARPRISGGPSRPTLGPRPSRAARLAVVGAGLFVLASLLVLDRLAPRPAGGPGAVARTQTTMARPLDVEAVLFRAGSAGREPLVTGSAIAPGDQLFLELETREPLHIYVLDEDDAGETYVLFPVAGLAPSNPLPAGALHRLPGAIAGVSHDWTVTSSGGRETILVVAARAPVGALEEAIAAIPPVRADEEGPRYARLDPEKVTGLRGIAGLAPSRPESASRPGRRLGELAREARSQRELGGAVWLREFELRNPASR